MLEVRSLSAEKLSTIHVEAGFRGVVIHVSSGGTEAEFELSREQAAELRHNINAALYKLLISHD